MTASRFTKGTLDHDGDGRKGGSRKGTTMAKDTKPAKRTRATKEQSEALAAAATERSTVPDPQSGGVSVVSEEQPSPAQVKKAQREALEAQFAEADGKGQPSTQDIQDARLGLVARGY